MPARSVILNYPTPTEKYPKFLEHHLQPEMKEEKLYVKDTTDFLDKLKGLGEITEGAILVPVNKLEFTLVYPALRA